MGTKILALRYELIKKIGDGGMSVVYKAKDRVLNRYVAIKILKPEFIKDPKFINSFRRESQAAAGLNHPNIVSIFDVGKEGNIYFIVMELLEGDSLGDIIQRDGALPERKAIEIAKQIALGLSVAHMNKVIHRDVKPHNILMTEDGIAKIADFGIAKAVNTGTIVNNTSTVMGSVHYLSPEQARGGYIDERSDIYSLGIVLYEMLTGTVPFDGENPVSVAMMHLNENVPAPSLVNPDISEVMDAIVMKASARHQANRFASADEMYDALVKAERILDKNSGRLSAVLPARKHSKNMQGANAAREGELNDGSEDRFHAADDFDYYDDFEDGGRKGRKSGTGKKKDKKKKKLRILAVILALICAIPLSLIIMNAFSGGDTVTVEDVRGLSQEQAENVLTASGLECTFGNAIYSDEYEEGFVAETNPAAGKEVKKGYTVKLLISKGSKDADDEEEEEKDKVKLPNLVGKTLSQAKKLLEENNLEDGEITYDENSTLPANTVCSQDPEAGEEVEEGTVVNLVVSKADDRVEVPDLLNRSEEKVKSLLKSSGLTYEKSSEEYSNDVSEGLVISQSPKAGTKVEEGTSVRVVLSKGPEKKESVAKPVALIVDYELAGDKEVFDLAVTMTDSKGNVTYVVNKKNCEKSDGGETVVLKGTGTNSKVRIIIDDEQVEEYTVNFETGELK